MYANGSKVVVESKIFGILLVWLTVFVWLFGLDLHAFPEMIRHGFRTCQTCHYDPNGGGLLNPTGRSISGSLLSQTSSPNEEKFLYGVIKKQPSWLHIGGDVRVLQSHQVKPEVIRGRFLIMQADVEAGAIEENLTFVGTVGEDSIVSPPYIPDRAIISRRHYALWLTPETHLSFRAGRFNHPFGLYIPEHATAIRHGLDWGVETETYNFESIYQNDSYDVFVTAIFGRPDKPDLDREKGAVTRARFLGWSRSQVGLSYYYGENNHHYRHVYGPHAIIGFTDKWVLLEEIALADEFVKNKNNDRDKSRRHGIVNYSKLSYEAYKGIMLFAMQDLHKLDMTDDQSMLLNYGLGSQYFPRPHFEFVLSWQGTSHINLSKKAEDLYYLMAHYYL